MEQGYFWMPELREYEKLVSSVRKVRCCDCPFCTPLKTKPMDGRCRPTGQDSVIIRNIQEEHLCFTHARLVLGIPV